MTANRSILVVDGDATLRQSLTEQFQFLDELTGVAVLEAADAASALLLFRQVEDKGGLLIAALLAQHLSDGDGRQLCQQLREQGLRCPVLLLSSGEDMDGTMLADCGANEMLAKPFRIGALLGKLRTQIALFERAEAEDIRIGPYCFQPLAKQLVADSPAGEAGNGKRRVRLTEKEVAILRHLQAADGEVVGRDVLLGEVWGYNDGVTTHTLETHIYRLRQKIEEDPSDARLLVTEAGGYRLVP